MMKKILILLIAILWASSANAQMGTWTKALVYDSLYQVVDNGEFVDSMNGYSLGCISNRLAPTLAVMRTSDGGLHWKMQPISVLPANADIYSANIHVLSPSTAFVTGVYQYSLLATTDSGLTWQILDSANGSGYNFWSATSGIHLVALDEVDITSDGGKTWKPIPNNPGFWDANTSLFSNGDAYDLGYIAQDSMHWLFPTMLDSELYCITTTNGGKSWFIDSTRPRNPTFSSPGWNSSVIWLTTTPTPYSTDFGLTWKYPFQSYAPVNPVTANTMFSVTNKSTFQLFDTSTVWESHDAGASWAPTDFDSVSPINMNFLNNQHGWFFAVTRYGRASFPFYREYFYTYHAPPAGVEHAPKPYLTHLSLNPDPATSEVTISGIQSPDDVIELFDMLGHKVTMGNTRTSGISTTIDVRGIPPGCYSFRITHGQTAGYCPFVKVAGSN